MDGVVGEMDEVVMDILNLEGFSRGPDVSLLEKVEVEVVGKECPNPNIELPFLDQKWSFHIFLDYKGTCA